MNEENKNELGTEPDVLVGAVIGRIKPTCNKCRASEFHNECSLGYWCESYTPKEPCPKPLTIRQLIDAPKSCH